MFLFKTIHVAMCIYDLLGTFRVDSLIAPLEAEIANKKYNFCVSKLNTEFTRYVNNTILIKV